ncbi:hypothetical protein E1A91_D01G149500v1 [Gossypium mustelinum]|uniref:Transcription initiation factor IIF subunit alpha n=1 Tax=Gossypium mustelinum TaxID=34275 RepID=A0A5D2W7A7_GOSMU|nr:hypothetical protein E1A91_D01G149500v1 [Gossypium mustelinum]
MPVQFVGSSILPGMKLMKGTIPFFTRISLLGFNLGFMTGFSNFSKKKNAENRWSLQKDGLQGRQVTDALQEKYKNKPWLLEDETGQAQYQGQLEGTILTRLLNISNLH